MATKGIERDEVLRSALVGLITAVKREVNDPQKSGGSGYLLARLHDAEDAVKAGNGRITKIPGETTVGQLRLFLGDFDEALPVRLFPDGYRKDLPQYRPGTVGSVEDSVLVITGLPVGGDE